MKAVFACLGVVGSFFAATIGQSCTGIPTAVAVEYSRAEQNTPPENLQD